jgi:hypothetical protein
MAMEQDERPDSSPPADKPRSGHRYRSTFWAIVLVGVGAVWLLSNFDIITADHLSMLAVLWPILLVGIGVDLLIGRRSPAIGGLVGVVTVGLIIIFMLLGPGLGWAGDTDLKTQTFSTPVGQATSATVALDLSSYSATVHALQSSASPERPLVTAKVTYQGSVDFKSTGDVEKAVTLGSTGGWRWWHWFDRSDATPWDIGLDPGLPLSLKVTTSSGSGLLDLSELRLADLQVAVSSGSTQVTLPPQAAQAYETELHVSSGDLEVQAPDGARVDMSASLSSGDLRVTLGAQSDVNVSFTGSSGGFTLELPAGQDFRVEVRHVSSGDVKLPSGLIQVVEGDDEEGTWKTQGYGAASHKVDVIIENLSSGDVTIRHEG